MTTLLTQSQMRVIDGVNSNVESYSTSIEDAWRAAGVVEKDLLVAVAVHRTIAKLADMNLTELAPATRFDGKELQGTFWDSLDAVAIQYELSKSLGYDILDLQMEKLPHPDFHPGLTIHDFVIKLLEVLEESEESE